MNLQQMLYIVAVNRHRHFGEAAAQCGVTQPTLSAMVNKLEEELGVKIFDRKKSPIQPTDIGFRVIRQAEVALGEIDRIQEIISHQSDRVSGVLRLGVIPTLAPYLIPKFIGRFGANFPEVELTIREMQTHVLLAAIRNGEVDMMVAATPLKQPDLLEIPIYYERFAAYFSEQSTIGALPLSAHQMPQENLWMLQEGHCLRSQTFNFCTEQQSFNRIYEAGSIDTLIRIVDENGGYSIIPEMHIPFLCEDRLSRVQPIENPPAVREVSLLIRHDFVREGLLNAVLDSFKQFIPAKMLDERLKKFSVRL